MQAGAATSKRALERALGLAQRKRGGEGLLDQLVLSIMDEDVQEVARVCSNHFGNWMMAHVVRARRRPQSPAPCPLAARPTAASFVCRP